MKKHKKTLMKSILALLLIVIMVIGACNKDEDKETPPSLPPESSIMIDFSLFPSDVKSAEDLKTMSLTSLNHFKASATVFIWTGILTLYMTIPTAAFVKVVNESPVYQGNKQWLWSYSFAVGFQTLVAELYGTIEDEKVNWEMYIFPEGSTTKFLWYSGWSNLAGTEGYWAINKDSNNDNIPEDALEIDWTKLVSEEIASVTFTDITGDSTDGSFISFGIDNSLDLNAYYDIYGSIKDNLIEIEWNTETYKGRIKDPLGYGDENWHCWDELLIDISCN